MTRIATQCMPGPMGPFGGLAHARSTTRVTDVREGEVYIAPSGRLCMLMPRPARGIGSDGDTLIFAYLSRGRPSKEDGFNLSRVNIGCLQKLTAVVRA